MSKKPKRVRRIFKEEFKRDAVNLVVNQGYSFSKAANAVGVASKSLREWHEKFAPEPEPCILMCNIAASSTACIRSSSPKNFITLYSGIRCGQTDDSANARSIPKQDFGFYHTNFKLSDTNLEDKLQQIMRRRVAQDGKSLRGPTYLQRCLRRIPLLRS